MFFLTMFVPLLLLILLPTLSLSVNPVTVPILSFPVPLRIRPFAQLPSDSSIISVIPFRSDLYVCTTFSIFKITPSGSVSLFLDVDAAIFQSTGRRLNTLNRQHGGVRSIAFHPDFSTNRLFYVTAMEDRPSDPSSFRYISDSLTPIPADSVLLEFRVDPATSLPIPSSYRNVFRVGMPVYDHPIKQMVFRGRLLYIMHGDGSVQSAVAGGGRNPDALGKVIRIDPRDMKNGNPYRIPNGNPYVSSGDFPPEVYAVGFRNPHHVCFGNDGTMFVADTGRDNVEEVNLVKRGRDYGWPEREGTFVHLEDGGLLNGTAELPVGDDVNGFEYPAAQVGHEGEIGDGFVGQAIAGGCPVENGSQMNGWYFYADFPRSGNVYVSEIAELKKGRTRGKPQSLTQARTWQVEIEVEEGESIGVQNGVYENMQAVVRAEEGFQDSGRTDMRFGRGAKGEIYISCKTNGRIYQVLSTVP